jgi:predicted nuclease of predicted toxin-antitoxin system
MKLLFDEDLSHKLVRRLADLFPDSIHVRDIGLKAADDPVVWEYARNDDLMIVSKDIRHASAQLRLRASAENHLGTAWQLLDIRR